jgi:hypothetical protein
MFDKMGDFATVEHADAVQPYDPIPKLGVVRVKNTKRSQPILLTNASTVPYFCVAALKIASTLAKSVISVCTT